MEAEYGTNILKLASGFRDTYRQQSSTTTSFSEATGAGSGGGGASYVKQGSYGEGWIHILELHERMGNNRLEFSRDLQVISEELSTIYKETDRSRKQVREEGEMSRCQICKPGCEELGRLCTDRLFIQNKNNSWA